MNIQYETNWRILEVRESARVVSLICKFHAALLKKVTNKTILGELSVHLNLNENFNIRSSRGNWGTIIFEIPKREWTPVSPNRLKLGDGIRIPVGLDTMNRVDYIDFSQPETAHLLISGGTGSGKTNVLSLLVYFLIKQNTPKEVKFLFINAQKATTELAPFINSAHRLLPVAKSANVAKERLIWLLSEMQRREERGYDDAIFVVIDEAEFLLAAEPETVSLIRRLVTTGRAENIHVITVSNNPTVSSLGDVNIKRNSLGRVIGVVDSADAAKVATGIADSGANKLVGKGDMLHLMPGQINRISVPEVKDDLLVDIPHSDKPVLDVILNPQEVPITRSVGRPTDPLDPKAVARFLMYFYRCQITNSKPLSASSLGRGMKPSMWGIKKVRRHTAMAKGILGELQDRGWRGL